MRPCFFLNGKLKGKSYMMQEISFTAIFEIKGLTATHQEELTLIIMDDWSVTDIESMKYSTAQDWIQNNINIHLQS